MPLYHPGITPTYTISPSPITPYHHQVRDRTHSEVDGTVGPSAALVTHSRHSSLWLSRFLRRRPLRE